MPNTSETRVYDALLSTTLENWAKGIEDTISTGNAFYYTLKRSNSWVSVDALGERCKFPLRYKNGTADTYSGLTLAPLAG